MMPHTQNAPRAPVAAAGRAVPDRLRLACVIALTCAATFLAGCQPLSRVARDPNLPSSVERLRTTTDILDVAEVDLPGIQSLACPACGTTSGDIRAGRELDLESLEILDAQPVPA
jgi:hypothetical protein